MLNDEFHVPDVFIVLLYMWWLNYQGYWFKQKQSYKISISTSMLCIIFARLAYCCCLSHKFWMGSDNKTLLWLIACFHATILIVLSFTHGAPIKQSCDWRSHRTANVARTPSRKWELNSNWLTAGKECGSILSSRLWEGALRDDTKNGCVADYFYQCWNAELKTFKNVLLLVCLFGNSTMHGDVTGKHFWETQRVYVLVL